MNPTLMDQVKWEIVADWAVEVATDHGLTREQFIEAVAVGVLSVSGKPVDKAIPNRQISDFIALTQAGLRPQ